jgi:hypothetical protein
MGMNLFTSHNSSPAATSVMRTVVSGILLSILFSDSTRLGIVEKLRAIDSLRVGAITKGRRITPLHFLFFQVAGEIAELQCSPERIERDSCFPSSWERMPSAP